MAQGEGMNTYHSQIVDALVSIGWTPPPVPPCPPIPVRRCIVWGCGNRSDQGKFNDNICWSCYNMLTSGKVGPGATFIHAIAAGSTRWKADAKKFENRLTAIRNALTSTQENQS